MNEQKITILGSGAMGSACASVLAHNHHNVTVYGIDFEELNDLSNGKNIKYFGTEISFDKVHTTTNLEEAINGASYVIFAIPSQFIPSVFDLVIRKINQKTIIINVSKGFWPDTEFSVHEQMSKLGAFNQKVKGIVSLIGPSFAKDIVAKQITLVDAVSNDQNLAQKVQKLFSNEYFRVYTQNDVKGAEAGSIFKNMIAIGSGILSAMNFDINTQIAMITRSINEIITYVKYIGGKTKTIFGLTGIGDLMLTAMSNKSRNYTYGLNFFNKKFDASQYTIEGLKSIEIIYNKFIITQTLDLPIIEALYKIIYLKEDPHQIINDLMKRPLKAE